MPRIDAGPGQRRREGEAGEAGKRSGDGKKPDKPSESSSCPVRQPLGEAALCGALSAFSAVFMALSQTLRLLAVSLEGLEELKTTLNKSVS